MYIQVGLIPTHPTKGSIEDMEAMTLPEKLEYLKGHKDWKCMLKWELEDEHAATWRTNGLASLDYSVFSRKEIQNYKCSIINVDVKLNQHEMTDSKCAL
jgi:hypothetical protein